MPEVMPCPNPRCGSTDCECLVCTINADESQTIHFHMACNKCFTSGPIADDAESAKKLWDSMPRALTWTHEPPKPPHEYKWGEKVKVFEDGEWWDGIVTMPYAGTAAVVRMGKIHAVIYTEKNIKPLEGEV